MEGHEGWDDYGSYLDTLVPIVLERLAAERLRITFFVVGQDAALVRNEKIAVGVSAHGHPVAWRLQNGSQALAEALQMAAHRCLWDVNPTARITW